MKNKINMELLSPAGKYDAFIAAVENGADAVYIGGSDFSARKNAVNFSNEEIKQATEYAHARGVKVYVALNTLLFDSELKRAYEFIKFCYEANVDALIVQDLGVLSVVRKFFPDFKVHASTQMTIHNLAGVKEAKKLGFKRVVLSRELSYNEIKHICQNTDVEIEVFVHGALCMCYSGQCLFSSMIGGRSGNRGQCAQPCRLPYTLYDSDMHMLTEKDKYLLSPKDLCLIDDIKKLNECGVTSLKIEGRMKNKEYVAIVTKMFDKYKSGQIVDKNDYSMLEQIFSRNGFTKGYFEDHLGAHMMNFDKSNDNIYKGISEDILSSARESIKENTRKFYIDGKVMIKKDCPIEITLSDKDGNSASVTGEKCADKAKNLPLTKERVLSQVEKLGNTPFLFDTLEINIEENINLPISEINGVRRQAVDALIRKRTKFERCGISKEEFSFEKVQNTKAANEYTAEVLTLTQSKLLKTLGFSKIYIPFSLYMSEKSYFNREKDVFCVKLPNILRDKYDACFDYVDTDEVVISNISQAGLYQGKALHADYSMNTTNSLAVKKLKDMGFHSVCLSPEMTISQIGDISKDIDTEIIVYGRIPLMTVQNCLIKSAKGKCGCSDKVYYLKDRKSILFPLKSNKGTCTNTIYNSTPLYMGDRMHEIKPLKVSRLKFIFTTESEEEIKKIVSAFENEKIYGSNYTRGHYYRGVLT